MRTVSFEINFLNITFNFVSFQVMPIIFTNVLYVN